VPGYGDFDNDNGLTRREIDFIVSWINGGAPRNNDCTPQNRTVGLSECEEASKRRRPEVKAEAYLDHWRFGRPHFERTLPSFAIRHGSTTTSVTFDLGLSMQRQVTAWEYRPADRQATRAVTFRLEKTGQWLGTWTPWRTYFLLPEGVAYPLGPDARIVAEISHTGAAERAVEGGRSAFFCRPGDCQCPAGHRDRS